MLQKAQISARPTTINKSIFIIIIVPEKRFRYIPGKNQSQKLVDINSGRIKFAIQII